jgi:hypothetical protein
VTNTAISTKASDAKSSPVISQSIQIRCGKGELMCAWQESNLRQLA